VSVLADVFERVGLVEREWIPGLGLHVHAHHLEAGAGVTRAGSTRATEQIKQLWTVHGATSL
jgi:hypothetical protein